MKNIIVTIKENREVAKGLYKMVLCGDGSSVTTPGQFINIKIDGLFLRRPISVSYADAESITIFYKVVGHGTEIMRDMQSGKELDILSGLGNGFDVSDAGDAPLLAGGGVGTAPMYHLAKELIAMGKKVTVAAGFNTKDDVFLKEELLALGAEVIISTADGSEGVKGFVTDAMKGLSYSFVYACGPEPMLKAVHKASQTDGQFSFEERMGCGFGACMGCTCKTITGYKRICKDGPVLKKGEILWED